MSYYHSLDDEEIEQIHKHMKKFQNPIVTEIEDDYSKFLKSEEKKPKQFDPLARSRWQLDVIRDTVNTQRVQDAIQKTVQTERDIEKELFLSTHDVDEKGGFKQGKITWNAE